MKSALSEADKSVIRQITTEFAILVAIILALMVTSCGRPSKPTTRPPAAPPAIVTVTADQAAAEAKALAERLGYRVTGVEFDAEGHYEVTFRDLNGCKGELDTLPDGAADTTKPTGIEVDSVNGTEVDRAKLGIEPRGLNAGTLSTIANCSTGTLVLVAWRPPVTPSRTVAATPSRTPSVSPTPSTRVGSTPPPPGRTNPPAVGSQPRPPANSKK